MQVQDIIIERIIPIEESFRSAQNAILEEAENDKIFFYKNASLRLATLDPGELNPVAMYLLEKNLKFQQELRKHLLDRYGIDTLRLSSILHLKDGDGKITGMMPPYVEISEERVALVAQPGDKPSPQEQILRIPLLIDGLHRVWLGREENIQMNFIVAGNLGSRYQYQAYPVSWSEVKIYNEVPKVKKHYRRQNPYTFMRPLESFRMTGPVTAQEYGR